ncbi:hypothetical protein SCHPADRAFT_906216 [Schizopora paradoxa]|uniref:Uncharacterized protein n=1 Tax=Schizopora paradoxa TaxID=27342 RepID=A0A0H2S2F1_9AGAM|nr:hypothetical protein SCHPADRAFT_906216 [Schizopora paradoxa]
MSFNNTANDFTNSNSNNDFTGNANSDDTANTLGFSTSAGVGGGDADYNPTSTDRDQQPAGDFGQFGGGIGDRTQGQGNFGGADVNQPSTGDQYGSSGGYGGQVPASGQVGQGQGQGMNATGGGGGDALDKGVDFLERKVGHEQSHSTTEKISDGLRKGFQKMTGRDVPIQDKDYQ